ncbi:MAG: ABC transporter permease [Saprospiraceae bacterium]|nr:ABC transporter permease [Saprospiraceae bacterium]MCB9321092.1 ABC transporter permease [Lewinellaceae bacterium]
MLQSPYAGTNFMAYSWRKFKQHALLHGLNLAGTALAFSALLLLFSYLYQSYTFEYFHQNRARIFRPTYLTKSPVFTSQWARIPVDYINALPDEIPEVEKLIRFQNQEQKYVRVGDKRFKPAHAYVTDAEVFQVFTFPFLAGDPATALVNPHSVVLTAQEALRYFGTVDALGKQIQVSGDWNPEEIDYTVTGIMQDLPANTHLPVTEFLSFDNPEERSGWAYVYILLAEHASIQQVEAKMADFVSSHVEKDATHKEEFVFQPLRTIHLQSHLAREIVPNGSSIYLSIFWSVGLFIWLILMVNFSNFNLAMTLSRIRETGVRKVLGASGGQLMWQRFLSILLQTAICGLLAWAVATILEPELNRMTGYYQLAPPVILLSFLSGLILVTALLTSLLPVVLSQSVPVIQAIRHGLKPTQPGKFNLRKVLITIQFSAATILVATTLIAYRQYQFIRHTQLGLQPEQVLAISNLPDAVVGKYSVYRDRLLGLPGVLGVSACMQVPSEEIRDSGPVMLKGTNQEPDQAPHMDIQIVDGSFFQMMDMQFLAGDDHLMRGPLDPYPEFNAELTPARYLAEKRRYYVINETAMRQLGIKDATDALGREINFSIGGFDLAYGPITGVIRDYHQESLRNKIDPLVIVVEPIWLKTFLVKIRPDQLDQTISAIESTWNDLFPYALEFHFLDDLFERLYREDRLQIILLGLLAILTLVISFLGSVSLLIYTLQRRQKELAIRRVIGARQVQLYGMISREYMMLLGLAVFLGMPVSWYVGRQWLNHFAYRTSISPWVYLLTLALTMSILLLLVWVVSYRTTRRNPVAFLHEDG